MAVLYKLFDVDAAS